jgi:hypothetical protein
VIRTYFESQGKPPYIVRYIRERKIASEAAHDPDRIADP